MDEPRAAAWAYLTNPRREARELPLVAAHLAFRRALLWCAAPLILANLVAVLVLCDGLLSAARERSFSLTLALALPLTLLVVAPGLIPSLYAARRARRGLPPPRWPGVTWLSAEPRLARLRQLALAGLATLLLSTSALALDTGRQVARGSSSRGRAYFLYDSTQFGHDALYLLAFRRAALAANAKWGPGAAVIAPITPQLLHEANQQGRFLFLATHGIGGELYFERRPYGPKEWDSIWRERWGGGESSLELVYLGACEASLEPSWGELYPRARLIDYSYKVSPFRHALWLWAAGPAELDALSD